MALLRRCVTFGVRRDDEAGRQRLARREPLALGVIQATSKSGWPVVERWKFLLKTTAISGVWWIKGNSVMVEVWKQEGLQQ